METNRIKLWNACRSFHEGPFDFRTINQGWKDAFLRLGFNPALNTWDE